MANAVANALTSFGAMPNQLPLSPARVWHMSSAKPVLFDLAILKRDVAMVDPVSPAPPQVACRVARNSVNSNVRF